jgi:hypothetical protein
MFHGRLTRISLALIAASALTAPLSLLSAGAPISDFDNHGITPEVKVVPLYPPTLTPAPGTYATPQTVKMTDVTVGSVFYYTTNGTNPTAASTRYTGPIPVTKTETIKVLAVASGRSSAIETATYTIQ